MKRTLTLVLAATFAIAAAQAGEVFVTKDAHGNLVYTDRPESLPAERVNVATKQTDKVEVKNRYDEEMKAYGASDQASADRAKQANEQRKAQNLSAEDKAKRCHDARARYEATMTAQRLWVATGTEGERHYLDSDEIDKARADSKKVMEDFCSQP